MTVPPSAVSLEVSPGVELDALNDPGSFTSRRSVLRSKRRRTV